MSVEEMISWLSQKPFSAAIPGNKADAIIAALKAGQAMRDEVQEMAEGGYYLSTPLELALEIWDDTTKETI